MKKSNVILLACICSAMIIFAGVCAVPFVSNGQTAHAADWDGLADTEWYDEGSEFTLTTAQQLAGLAVLVNEGNNLQGKTIYLGANIALNDTSDWTNWNTDAPTNAWTPIGGLSSGFSGIFDGQNHTVSGIYINDGSKDYQGFFGYSNQAEIKNMGVAESYIKGNDNVGGLVGASAGAVINNCYNSGIIVGNQHVGGVVGANDGTISDCYNTGDIDGMISGGIAGYMQEDGTITDCYNIGAVTGSQDGGDIVGLSDSIAIVRSYYLAGGLAGAGGEEKTADAFTNGQVAYLLQNGRTTVWGHTELSGLQYPSLIAFNDTARAVIKITFNDTYHNDTTEKLILSGDAVDPLPVITARQGYSVDWEIGEQQITISTVFDEDAVATAVFTAGNSAYTVKHYKQDSDGYTLADTENLQGTTDTTATAISKDYEGFAENTEHVDSKANGTILGDGSLVLELYYDKLTYTVTLPSGTGYTATAVNDSVSPVNYDGSFSFEIALANSHNESEITVKVNDAEITAVDGVYTLSNITADQTVSIDGVEINKYTVTLPSGTGYTATAVNDSVSPVNYDGSFSFEITLVDSHNESEITIKVNDVAITAIDGVYTISNIVTDQIVTIDGVEINTYIVTLPSGTGYTATAVDGSSSPVNYDGSFSFEIVLANSHNESVITVKVNDVIITAVDGIYTISNITADQTVTIDGVEINTYTVTLPSGAGYTATAVNDSSSPVNYDGSFSFEITLADSHNESEITVKVNDIEITAVGGIYTISNIVADQTVTIDGVEINTYTVTLPSGIGYTASAVESSSPVNYDGSFSFEIVLANSHNESEITVKVNDVVITAVDGVYILSNITADQTVTIDGVAINTYAVTLPSGAGYTATAVNGSSSPVNYDGSFSFEITLADSHNESEITIKVNDVAITAVDGIYTISNITADQTVTIDGVEINTYTVTLPSGAGYTASAVESSSPVNYDGSFSFEITLADSHNESAITIKVNDVVITAVDGVYILSNITADQTVTIDGVAINTYAVTLPSGAGYTATAVNGSSSPVNYDGSFNFEITLADSHNESEITVKVNDVAITAVDGVYTISNIVADQTVTIDGLAINTYTVTLPSGIGYTASAIESSSPVNYDGSFSFEITLADSHNESAITIKVNDAEITAVDGIYTLSNIVADQTVTIDGVAINTYAVTLPSGAGYTATAVNGSSSPVNYDGSFNFEITLADSHNESEITVKVNDVAITAVDGVYTISNIVADQTVTIDGLAINTYTVTLPSGIGYTASAIESSSPVNYDGSFSFEIALANSHNESEITVKVNDAEITAVDGIYTLSNIVADQTVTIDGVEINTYTVTLPSGAGYTATAVNDSVSPVDYDGSFSFEIALADSHNESAITIKVNDVAITAVDGVYTISNIVADQTVTIDGLAINTYTVTLPSGTGYTATAINDSVSPVDYDGSFSFEIALDDKYSNSELIVKTNGIVIVDIDGVYTIDNIVADQAVTIDGVEIYTYTVALPSHAGYTITAIDDSSSPVDYNDSFSFEIVLADKYSNSNLIVKTNNIVLVATNGVYTIANIAANQTVTIDGLAINTYTVTLPSHAGYTITAVNDSVSPVNYDGSFSFTVALADKYSNSQLIVSTNNIGIVATNGVYTINNIRIEQSVTVSGMKPNKYVVTFNGDGGIYKSGGIQTQMVEHNKDAVASVYTRDGYTFDGWDKEFENVVSDLIVTAKWKAVTYAIVFKGDIESGNRYFNLESGVITLPKPEKDGHVFQGWFATSDFSGEALTSLEPRARNVTLYAKWEAVDSGLPGWAIALIVVASVLVAAVAGFAIAKVLKKKGINKGDTKEDEELKKITKEETKEE